MIKTAEKLIEDLDLSMPREADKVMRKLAAVCHALQRKLFSGGKDNVRLEPGFVTNDGFEQKVVVQIARGNYRDILFRAFVPLDGYPVVLDFYGEEPTRCASEQDMDRAVGEFIEQPEIRARLKQYSEMAK